MKWFDQWSARKCKWAWEHRDLVTKSQSIEPKEASRDDGLRTTIKKIIGGSVVTFKTYDRRTESRHYTIVDEQDFDTKLGKIITMKSMRKI
jgi:transcription elongation GreA/GreB family factor